MRRLLFVLALLLGCRRPSEDTEGRAPPPTEKEDKEQEKPTKALKVDFSAEAGPAKPRVGATYAVTMEVTNESDEDIDGFDVQIMGAKSGFVLVSAAPTSATTEVIGSTFVGHYSHSIDVGKKVDAVLSLVAKTPGNYSVTIRLTSRSSKRRLVDSSNKTWSLTAPVIVLP